MTENTVTETTPSILERPQGNVEFTATDPRQIPQLQANLAVWCRQKVAAVEGETDDAVRAVEAAAAAGMKIEPLQRLANRHAKRLIFYQKVLAALEAGYVLMPTLQASIFAVRTKRQKPTYELVKFHRTNLHDVPAQALPAGEGHYVSNVPLSKETTGTHEETKDYQTGEKQTKAVVAYFASGLDTEVEFPLDLARPELIEATSRAMAYRVFDEIALAPPRWQGSGDPILLGQIIAPDKRRISFLIAWHVPTIDL